MLGVSLQTWGVWFSLKAFQDGLRESSAQDAAVTFALAACVKQQDVVCGAIGLARLASSAGPGRRRSVARAAALGLALIASYDAAEEVVTRGMMSRSVFTLPRRIGTLSPGSWDRAWMVLSFALLLSAGPVASGAASALTSRSGWRGSRIDGLLMIYFLGELAWMVALCRLSSGSWVNYAAQPVVFANILVARALSRSIGTARRAWRLLPIGLSAALVLSSTSVGVVEAVTTRRRERLMVSRMLADPRLAGRTASEFYFLSFGGTTHDLSQHNRLHGRCDPLHDDWLYRAFESLGASEPRSRWLLPALSSGTVRVVVSPLRGPDIPGLTYSLSRLGFRPIARYGRFHVWSRERVGPVDASHAGL